MESPISNGKWNPPYHQSIKWNPPCLFSTQPTLSTNVGNAMVAGLGWEDLFTPARRGKAMAEPWENRSHTGWGNVPAMFDETRGEKYIQVLIIMFLSIFLVDFLKCSHWCLCWSHGIHVIYMIYAGKIRGVQSRLTTPHDFQMEHGGRSFQYLEFPKCQSSSFSNSSLHSK